ncbi:hypothetical protein BSK56_12195 [Paenibacillus borealis]|uniref:Uncharacterized protein n=1 Tax=Paenibacillus borealis TaxID=160799 RepID=A0ABX3HC50_PAEBO|nr:hypothetical protein BSK56_12195 [Paenibacillus borealis]
MKKVARINSSYTLSKNNLSANFADGLFYYYPDTLTIETVYTKKKDYFFFIYFYEKILHYFSFICYTPKKERAE